VLVKEFGFLDASRRTILAIFPNDGLCDRTGGLIELKVASSKLQADSGAIAAQSDDDLRTHSRNGGIFRTPHKRAHRARPPVPYGNGGGYELQ